MAITPHSIDIVCADIARTLTFFKVLGLDTPARDPDAMQVQIATPGGASIGLIDEGMMREHNPQWQTPVGQRVTFACRCDSVTELDAAYARVEAAGFAGLRAPWDAFWGQRYAFLQDPDGNRIDLFAAITPEGVE
jgi:predicted enzyme related to lactoylglutathione lyase